MPIVADPTAYIPEHVLTIDLSQIKWRATGSYLDEDAESHARLTATIKIGGADHHLEALQVTKHAGMQCGVTGTDEELDALYEFAGGDGEFETVSIEGREYVISMHPFQT